jgi:SAM-dependent methyltransferase
MVGDVAGRDVVELGCGTAYVSAWLARRGARVVGVDLTPEQLDTARRLQEQHGLSFPLVEASAEAVPLPDESFDLAVSEYGAKWVDQFGVDFHLGYGDWIGVLGSHGFEVERLVELRNPGRDSGRYELFTAEWAERWPAEEMWKARKTA